MISILAPSLIFALLIFGIQSVVANENNESNITNKDKESEKPKKANFVREQEKQKKCVLVMSYHKGYEWNDGIEKGVVDTLKGVCELKKIYLDTKRNTSYQYGKSVALKAKKIIDEFKPDVLIAADDNASLYLVEPYYKNKTLPVVFCGLNWTAKEYGYPYKNATGMVEVAPILPLLKNIQRSFFIHNKAQKKLDESVSTVVSTESIKQSKQLTVNRPLTNSVAVKTGVYLSSEVITEHKDFLRYQAEYASQGVDLIPEFVSTIKQWKAAFLKAQKADFVILNNNAGIVDWDEEKIIKFVLENSTTLTVTNYRWMMPYVMLGMTKKPQEQGRWAGEVAKAVINGLPISSIPVNINKSWSTFVNTQVLQSAGITLSNKILNHAHKSW